MTNDRSTSPIRVALCITELEVGGAERCLTELACRLDRSRFWPTVYSLGGRPAPPRDLLVRQLEQHLIPVYFLDAQSALDFPRAWVRLARLLRHERPALAQTFLFHANIVGRLAARAARVPHVICGIRVAERGRRWHLWLDRATSRLVDRYVCVSQGVADFSEQVGRLPARKLAVIPNGIDVAQLGAPEACKGALIRPGRRLVLYAGRLEAQKRVDWLLRLAPRFLDPLAGHDLAIVGDGSQASELAALADRLGLAERVLFFGWRADVIELLRASDLLVLPSAWEGMPNVVLEAMACGKPVVSCDVEGVRELLDTRQIVAPEDAAGFGSRVVELAQNAALREAIGSANRDRVTHFFSIDAMVKQYMQLWDSLAGEGVK